MLLLWLLPLLWLQLLSVAAAVVAAARVFVVVTQSVFSVGGVHLAISGAGVDPRIKRLRISWHVLRARVALCSTVHDCWLESDAMKWIRNSLVAIRVSDGDYMYVECFNARLIMVKKQFSDNQLQHMV